MFESLPERLKYLRESLKLTQSEAGERLGLDRKAVSAFETGSRTPTAELLVKMAALYRTTTDFILGVSHQDVIALEDLDKFNRQTVRYITNLTITAIQDFIAQQKTSDS